MTSETAQAHLNKLQSLLQVERAHERETFVEKMQETPLQERVKQGLTWYPLVIKSSRFVMGNRQELTLVSTKNLPVPSFRHGQPARLFVPDSNETLMGLIVQVRDEQATFLPYKEELPEAFEGTLALEAFLDENTYREMDYALERLSTDAERLGELREVAMGTESPTQDISLPSTCGAGLNDSQNEALKHVLQAKDFGLIHGPPGTGKTTTLTSVINALVSFEKQVLVCAPSNTAVDLLTEKSHLAGLKVLRLGHPARMSDDLKSLSLDMGILNHPNYQVIQSMRTEARLIQRKARKFKRNFDSEAYAQRKADLKTAGEMFKEARQLEKQLVQFLLDEAQVVTATLVGASHRVLKGRTFQTVIIDEAAQALEPAAWIPILKANRAILAGDHCQLPPTIKSPKAQKLSETLFERLILKSPEAGRQLKTQYRMNDLIMGYSNQVFYNNELKSGKAVSEWRLEADISPLTWIDTAGCGYEENQNPDTLSYSNPQEGELLLNYLNLLLPQLKSPISIGLISPYRGQVKWLKTHLRLDSNSPHSVSIDSIDGFQGQERDLICISMARSNEEGIVGFLKDTRRMNVAMTRARKKLVMVGDSATLGNHSFYADLLEFVMAEEGAYESAWEYMNWDA